jgi:hypothetical protein
LIISASRRITSLFGKFFHFDLSRSVMYPLTSMNVLATLKSGI